MYRRQIRRRRAILVGLLVVALLMLSLHFAEPKSGPLHTLQRGIATVLSPFEAVATTLLAPGRAVVDWFDETFEARGENEELKAELEAVRSELASAQQALGENEDLAAALEFQRGDVVAANGYTPLEARVIARSPSVWYSTVKLDKGSSDGVELDDPVVGPGGLVGRVTNVAGGTSQVQLITDPRSGVTAKVLPDGPEGVLVPEAGDPGDLSLEFVENEADIESGQILITAGWKDDRFASAYPRGIEIGEIAEAEEGEEGTQVIRVEPFADLRDLAFAQILVGGSQRVGVTG